MLRRLPLITALAAVLIATPAAAATGRVAFPVGLAAPATNVDAGGATAAVALPDGGAVLFSGDQGKGFVAAALRADGSLDTSFGTGGITHVPVGDGRFILLHVLRRPDGRLVVVGTEPARSTSELPQLTVVQLNPNGVPDPSFGANGVAQPGIQGSCENCEPAALAPDGSLVLTGNAGTSGSDFAWVVARLTPAGALDPAFGQGGVETVPGTSQGSGYGYGAAVGADGRMTVVGSHSHTALLARLRPDGTADPSFAGGSPATLPDSALHFVLAPDGSTTLLGSSSVFHMAPDGTPDRSYGDQGVVNLGPAGFARLLGAPDGGVLAYRPSFFGPRATAQPTIVVDHLDPSGTRTTTNVSLEFGGGLASFFRAQHRILAAPSLQQNAFTVGQLLVRPDGSYLAAGGVTVVQYSGEGEGDSTAQFAAAALTPALAPDTSFGPSTPAPRASTRLVSQHATGDYRLRGVAVRLTASDAGLARIRVSDRRNHTLALGVEPVYTAGTATVRVQIAKAGTTVLRRGHRIRVRVTATFRDLLARSVTARAVTGTLR